MRTCQEENNKIRKYLKKLWHFVSHHNAVVIALELAIFVGVIFAFAAPSEQELGIMNYESGNNNIAIEQFSNNQVSNKTTTSEQLAEDSPPPENLEITRPVRVEKLSNLEELKIKEIGPQKFAFKTLDGSIIEIGIEKHSPPQPYAKLNKWDGECSLSVSLPTDAQTDLKLENGKVKWIEDKREVHMYPLEPREFEENGQIVRQLEQGGFEFEIILKKKPKTNVITLNIETKGLKFYYQPELTQEQIDRGDFRPKNVVGSYAVYHATKGNMHPSKEEAEKYKAGKAFHIYRPKITDAEGNWVWEELNISDGILTITIPQGFLDKAIYPISSKGTTFGDTGIGDSSHIAYAAGSIWGSDDTGAAGTGVSMSWYGDTYSSSYDAKFGLYKTDDYLETNGTTNTCANCSATTWHTEDFTTAPTLSAQTYILSVFMKGTGAAGYGNHLYYDDATGRGWYKKASWATWPDPISWDNEGTLDYLYSIYCTYTPAGEEEEYQPRPGGVGVSGGAFLQF